MALFFSEIKVYLVSTPANSMPEKSRFLRIATHFYGVLLSHSVLTLTYIQAYPLFFSLLLIKIFDKNVQ